MPEYTADTGIKKGEKVDYAILKDDKIKILIECKKYGEDLNIHHASQLYRYFSVTEARIAILTNGRDYKFYTDLDAPNKMDNKPFLELDMLDIDEHIIPEIKKITKPAFDVESIINAAGELKYVSQLKKNISNQFLSPDDELVRFYASDIYDGSVTQKVKEQFKPLLVKAFQQYLSDQVNDRLKSAINQGAADQQLKSPNLETEILTIETEQTIENVLTETQDEKDAFNIIRAITRQTVNINRVFPRKTKSYYGILLDDNNRKPICRLHFSGNIKYIGLFDNNKKETRHTIETLDDIFKFADDIQNTAKNYDTQTSEE